MHLTVVSSYLLSFINCKLHFKNLEKRFNVLKSVCEGGTFIQLKVYKRGIKYALQKENM